MRNLLHIVTILIAGDLIFSRCANPVSPTGGPKDTIPPELILSNPLTGSTNFKQESITLNFSEFINADKLTQNLIITPKSDIKFKHVIKRNQLHIKFEDSFDDSTTYSLNFFDGVTDITEKNPAVNLIIAFSTGSFIDSMQVRGTVRDLLTNEPSDKFIVGLFPNSDTLDFLEHSPTYFTTANDSGEFSLSYVKSGEYRIMAFKDENRNLLLDPKEEAHGFRADTLLLYDSIPPIEIASLIQNVKPIQIVNNRPIRSYHEIKLSREIDSYQIQPDSIYSSISGTDGDVLRLYNVDQFNYGDSTSIVLTVSDSLSNTILDTLKMVFNEYSGRVTEWNFDLSYPDKTLTNNPLYTIKFNKPVLQSDTSKIFYRADSTFTLRPDSTTFLWNHNKTELQLQTFLNKDSIYSRQKKAITLDSTMYSLLGIDTIQQWTPEQSDSLKQLITSKSPIHFVIQPNAFISVENDSSNLKEFKHRKEFVEPFGTLQFTILTDHKSFIVQLLSSNNEVAYQTINDPSPAFNVRPASYSIRILIDSNGDGKWSFGNLLRDEEPEEVYLFPQAISIRENWVVGEDIQISF